MPKPIVASYCTTFLKPEMLHIYRQVAGLQKYHTVILTRERRNEERFPFDSVEVLPRPRSNFIRRFYLKYIRRTPPIFYRGEFQVLRKTLHRCNANLMHVYFGHTGVHLLPFIKAWERPTIVSFHGADVMERAEQPEYGMQLRDLLVTVPIVLARSKSLCERLENLGCPTAKIRLNRTGIPLDQYPFKERVTPEKGNWRFVQACRLIPKKGIATAIRAFALFHKGYPNARFIIAGEGPLKEEIKELVRALGLAGSVELRGFLSQKDLYELYSTSHLFVHPSELTPDLNQEGVPNSMLEAMATGLPVLATLHGGIPEAVTHERTGLLVSEKNHEALYRAMCQLIESGDYLFKMGKAASELVSVEFEHAKQISKLETYYDEARGI